MVSCAGLPGKGPCSAAVIACTVNPDTAISRAFYRRQRRTANPADARPAGRLPATVL